MVELRAEGEEHMLQRMVHLLIIALSPLASSGGAAFGPGGTTVTQVGQSETGCPVLLGLAVEVGGQGRREAAVRRLTQLRDTPTRMPSEPQEH